MVWDLGKAMRKKEEFESARLIDFEFHQRTRAIRLMLAALGREEAGLVADLAVLPEPALIVKIAGLGGIPKDEAIRHYQACLGQARQQLIAERGDPSPVRLG